MRRLRDLWESARVDFVIVFISFAVGLVLGYASAVMWGY